MVARTSPFGPGPDTPEDYEEGSQREDDVEVGDGEEEDEEAGLDPYRVERSSSRQAERASKRRRISPDAFLPVDGGADEQQEEEEEEDDDEALRLLVNSHPGFPGGEHIAAPRHVHTPDHGIPLHLRGQGGTLIQVETGEDGDKGRRKITIQYIEKKEKRHITFSKRKAGIMKKVSIGSTILFASAR